MVVMMKTMKIMLPTCRMIDYQSNDLILGQLLRPWPIYYLVCDYGWSCWTYNWLQWCEYDGSFHIGFINWEEESSKMATGSMCTMQCNVKRWGCDDDIDDGEMITWYL